MSPGYFLQALLTDSLTPIQNWLGSLTSLSLGIACLTCGAALRKVDQFASSESIRLVRYSLGLLGLAHLIRTQTWTISIPTLDVVTNASVVLGCCLLTLATPAALRAYTSHCRSGLDTISELKCARDELLAKVRRLEMFTQAAAHDLREPLRMINSYLRLLSRDYPQALDARGVEFLEFARQGGVRLENLLMHLMAFFRSGKDVRKEHCNLNESMQNVRSDLEALLQESNTKLVYPELPVIQADPVLIVQILENLITNGIRYSRADVEPLISVGAELRDGHWHIWVKDNGLGIPKESLCQIFQPFRRSHNPDIYEGTGLGLAICQAIAEGHGGHMLVESAPGQGSTFTLVLPLS